MRPRHGWLLGCLLTGIALAGCASTSSNDPIAAADAHFNGTVAMGAAAGCAAGAAGGALIDRNNRGVGALIGCALGALGGGTVGYAVARNNAAQAHTEADLNADIAAAQNDVAVAQGAATAAAQETAAAQSEAAALSTKLQAGQITLADYHSDLAGYQKDSDEMHSLIQRIDERETNYQTAMKYATPAQAQQLGQATQELDTARSNLLDSYTAMQQALAARPAA